MVRTLAVTGASGFIGRALVHRAAERGMRVIALGRADGPSEHPPGVEVRSFDPNDASADPRAFEGADAVVHLAGESIDGRWTPEKKERIARSRIEGTRNVVAALEKCATRPSVFVCASAAGFYGSRGDEPLFETSRAGDGFLASVCRQWEREAMRAQELGIRTVMLRTGIALGQGGALEKMRAPFAFGAGGPLGSGRQFVPWIHLDDLADLYCFAVERSDIQGALNAVAPDYATNARFAQAIGTAMRRPSLLPAPGAALRLMLGEFAQTVLASQLMIPARAQDAGFPWKHPNLERAIQTILAPHAAPASPHRFQTTQIVPADICEVFDFFSDARNLEAITPAMLRFQIDKISGAMQRGTIIDYRLRLRGAPLKWKTLITEWNAPHGFVDVQLHGPYASWRHEHRFTPVKNGVEISDTVEYLLPFAPLGTIAFGLVRRDVEAIFRHRESVIAQHFHNTLARPYAIAGFSCKL